MPQPIDPLARLPEEWVEALAALGEPPYRAAQIFRWIHHRGVIDPEAMTNLPKALRLALHEAGLAPPLQLEREHRSADGARKLVARLNDGAAIETVLLPVSPSSAVTDADAAAVVDDDDEPKADGAHEATIRVTQCISTQVGCALGCVFCASGAAGLKRHLTAGEISAQVLLGRDLLEPNESLGNVVLMGMGEPLHNYDATARAIRLLTHPAGLGLSPRRITLSTVGLPDGLRRLGEDFGGQIGLAISLHSANNVTRSALMPVNRRHPVGELLEALRHYPAPPGRPITIEIALIRGQNDGLADARQLAKALRGLRVKINLIPMNPIDGSPFGPPASAQIRAFQDVLRDAGYLCFLRRRRGDDVAAACGQLVRRDVPG